MDIQIVTLLLLSIIAAVNGVCDRNAVTTCITSMSSAGATDLNEQCTVQLPEFQECIDEYKDDCKGDPVMDQVTPLVSSYNTLCATVLGGSGCTFTHCMSQLPQTQSGQQPVASPEFCGKVMNFKTCVKLQKEKANCDPKDQNLAQVQSISQSYDMLCSPSGCTFTHCMSQLPQTQSGEQPVASPEFCGKVTNFKTCVKTQQDKAKCDPNDENLVQVQTISQSYDMLCSDCNAQKMMVCLQLASSLSMQGGFTGIPSSDQVEPVCQKMNEFKTCIQPVQTACSALNNPQSQQVTKMLSSTVRMVDFFCTEEIKSGIKTHSPCLSKPSYQNVTAVCMQLETPPADGNSHPKSEKQDEMCNRIQKQFDCYTEKTKLVCSEDTANFVKKFQASFYPVIAEPLNCPISGSPLMTVQIWMVLSLLFTAFFLN